MRKSVIIFSFTWMGISLSVHNYAQLIQPDQDKILNYTEIINTDDYPRGERQWVVFSDRTDNPVYKQNSISSEIVNNAGFLETFIVIDEVDDFLKLAAFSKPEKQIGWMPKKNLVIFSRGMISENIVAEKVLLTEILGSVNPNTDNYETPFFLNPDLTDISVEKNFNSLGHFYVFKETENALLLGRIFNLEKYINWTDNLERDVAGWVNKKNVIRWNNRIAVQPSYVSNNPYERRANDKPAIIFSSPDWAAYYMNNCDNGHQDIMDTLNYLKMNKDSIFLWVEKDFSDTPWQNDRPKFLVLDGCYKPGIMKVVLLRNSGLDNKEKPFIIGYAPVKVKGIDQRLWNFDVLVTSSSLKVIINDIRKYERSMMFKNSIIDQRHHIFEVFMDLVNVYAGDKIFDNLTVKLLEYKGSDWLNETRLSDFVFVPWANGTCVDFTDLFETRLTYLSLNDILVSLESNSDIVSLIILNLKKRSSDLQDIVYSSEGLQILGYDQAYWVPVEVFPFMR